MIIFDEITEMRAKKLGKSLKLKFNPFKAIPDYIILGRLVI